MTCSFPGRKPPSTTWTLMMMVLVTAMRISPIQAFSPLLMVQSVGRGNALKSALGRPQFLSTSLTARMASNTSSSSTGGVGGSGSRGKLLVLGGTGFLGQTICRRALLEGYGVTSLSRRGLPPPSSSDSSAVSLGNIDYRSGDARKKEAISNILQEGDYVGVVHCIGLLFDDASGLGNFNRFVSGSGSLPDADSTYDSITRLSAFNAIDATVEYVQQNNCGDNFPFVFTSAAEAGWPDMPGGPQIEQFLAPEWLRRYLIAKRSVEAKLMNQSSPPLRPIIPRPSLVYSLDRPASYAPVGAFFIGNKLGLPFVDRPVTVQSLANAIVRSISRDSVRGVQRYTQIDDLNK